jgi:signal recognition particle subunit SRP72
MPPKTKAPPQKKPAASAKPARKAKTVLSETEQLKRLFRALCAQIDGGHLVNAVKTCDKSM